MPGFEVEPERLSILRPWNVSNRENIMDLTASIKSYRRYLKKINYSVHTVKNYLNRLKHFLTWLPVRVEAAAPGHVKIYLDRMLEKRMTPKTINDHLYAIRSLYRYLHNEEGKTLVNPAVKGMALCLRVERAHYAIGWLQG